MSPSAPRRSAVEFARIHIPCRRDRYTDKSGPDGGWPTPEPPHRINQIYLDPLAGGNEAASHPKVRFLNLTRVRGFTQDGEAGVAADAEDLDGRRQAPDRLRLPRGL